MEIKINKFDDAWFTYNGTTINWCEDFNFFGDPALNIIYENIETVFPDLTIKGNEITFNNEISNKGDVVTIEANIRNIMNIDIVNSFNVECYCINLLTSESVLLGTNLIEGMIDVQHVTTNFTWETADFESALYEIQIIIDKEGSITELNEQNNTNSTQKGIHSYTHNHFISTNTNRNASVMSIL